MDPICDKCRRPVDVTNSIVVLSYVMSRMRKEGEDCQISREEILGHVAQFSNRGRHLLPVVEGDNICEGSPSRAQYLEGQPHDARGGSYNPNTEHLVRAAHRRIMEYAPY